MAEAAVEYGNRFRGARRHRLRQRRRRVALRRATHASVAGVSQDYERQKYNTAIAKLMELSNTVRAAIADDVGGEPVREAMSMLLLMLAPVAPFITEELWSRIGNDGSVHEQRWPVADPVLLEHEQVVVAVQVNGRTRGTVSVRPGAPQSEVEAVAAELKTVQPHVAAITVTKAIFVEDRIINFVGRPLEPGS